jgi:pilus assembly protein CpaE
MGEPKSKFTAMRLQGAAGSGAQSARRVGVVEGALGGPERFASLAALFPDVLFESVGAVWPDRLATPLEVLIVPVSGASPDSVSDAVARLKAAAPNLRIVIVLSDADVTTTRRLIREGAADVLPLPISEASVALCLERLLVAEAAEPAAHAKPGEVIAFLKAGGGVGATALVAQVASILAARGQDRVCLADLDVQFGAAALYLDLPEAVSLSDLLGSKTPLVDAPFGTALTAHRSGAFVLAAPRDVMPLEALNPALVAALMKGLRREFRVTLVDLPSVWTAWTNQVLTLADRIVLVTHLSVPHIQLVKRQLRVLAEQKLADHPVTLVCNAVSKEQQDSVSLKAAERALGRPFDVVIPEDHRLVTAAINQGLELSAVRRGTKVEKAVIELADAVGAKADAPTAAHAKTRLW